MPAQRPVVAKNETLGALDETALLRLEIANRAQLAVAADVKDCRKVSAIVKGGKLLADRGRIGGIGTGNKLPACDDFPLGIVERDYGQMFDRSLGR